MVGCASFAVDTLWRSLPVCSWAVVCRRLFGAQNLWGHLFSLSTRGCLRALACLSAHLCLLQRSPSKKKRIGARGYLAAVAVVCLPWAVSSSFIFLIFLWVLLLPRCWCCFPPSPSPRALFFLVLFFAWLACLAPSRFNHGVPSPPHVSLAAPLPRAVAVLPRSCPCASTDRLSPVFARGLAAARCVWSSGLSRARPEVALSSWSFCRPPSWPVFARRRFSGASSSCVSVPPRPGLCFLSVGMLGRLLLLGPAGRHRPFYGPPPLASEPNFSRYLPARRQKGGPCRRRRRSPRVFPTPKSARRQAGRALVTELSKERVKMASRPNAAMGARRARRMYLLHEEAADLEESKRGNQFKNTLSTQKPRLHNLYDDQKQPTGSHSNLEHAYTNQPDRTQDADATQAKPKPPVVKGSEDEADDNPDYLQSNFDSKAFVRREGKPRQTPGKVIVGRPTTLGANRLFVSNVNQRIHPKQLELFFSFFADLPNTVKVVLSKIKLTHPHSHKPTSATDRPAYHRGFGVVSFPSSLEASKFLLQFQGCKLGERAIRLEEAYSSKQLKMWRTQMEGNVVT
eukprot:GHVT01066650.1.p1 GENE.GHVT01066650.1~~GHVT01066650.1.p1  ORF type:complete len:569 (-),score=75.99 GHVT01066650.1:1929-3635(-)